MSWRVHGNHCHKSIEDNGLQQAGCCVQLGDYYAAAKICGAPVPPPDVISRGVTFQVRY